MLVLVNFIVKLLTNNEIYNTYNKFVKVLQIVFTFLFEYYKLMYCIIKAMLVISQLLVFLVVTTSNFKPNCQIPQIVLNKVCSL